MTLPPRHPDPSSLPGGHTPAQECREVEKRHPDWHVWLSLQGHPWATRTRHDSVMVLEGKSFELVDHVIAEFEWNEAHGQVTGS